MIKKTRFPKIFFGWWTVLAAGILPLWAAGFQVYGISALFKPISSELGFSRTVASVPASLARFEGGLEAPLSGWLTDKYGPRWIIFGGVFFVSVSLILMNWVNSLLAFYLVWGLLLGTAFNLVGGVPAEKAITNWFIKKRGLAGGIKWVFSGLSGVLVLPLIAWLITSAGWRMTCVIGGVVMGVVGLPLTLFCFKQHRPEHYGLLPDGAVEKAPETTRKVEQGVQQTKIQELEFTVKQAMKTPGFWLLIVMAGIHGLATPVMNIHTIPFLTDQGIDPVKAAGMMSLFILASIPARISAGFIADRAKTSHLPLLVGGAYVLQAAGFAVYLLNPTIAMVYVWFILYGIGMGAVTVLPPVIRARYYGRKSFGAIHGISTLLIAPVGVAAPVYAGWVYDTTGKYIAAYILLVVLLVIAAAVSPFARPPKPPTQSTEMGKLA